MRLIFLLLVLGLAAARFLAIGTLAGTASQTGRVLFVVLLFIYGLAVAFGIRGRKQASH